MRRAVLLLAFALLAGRLVDPGSARAGVPRSCIRPQADPLACARDTREVTHRVMPSRRVRALRERRPVHERVAPVEDRHRNRLLEQIRRERCTRC